MKTTLYLPLLLLLSACGALRETAAVQDDVYDVPDRQALAAAAASQPQDRQDSDASDAYYDPQQSRSAGVAGTDYYNMAYNDPYYYNYGRFGFGTGIGSYGPSMGMGMSYGWPTSFGSMSVGYGMGYGYGGYNPYWSNSWMSGYGYTPYSPYGYGNPYGYYGYGNYGYGYGGYGMGYGPYQGPWGGCYSCYEPIWNNNVVYSHRPSMAGGTAGSGSTTNAPRMMRNSPGLLQEPVRTAPLGRVEDQGPQRYSPGRTNDMRPARTATPQPAMPGRTPTMETRPSRSFDRGGDFSPSRSFGGGGGGGGERISSPRPR